MNGTRALRILLALDEGPEAEEAVRGVLSFVRSRPVRIHVLHVSVAGRTSEPGVRERFLEQARRTFAAAGIEADLLERKSSGLGVGRDIVATAGQADVDLIALASHGVGDVRAILHGSVSHEVLAEAVQPVLLLRGETAASAPQRILVATDGADEARVQAALALVALPASEVTVLHVPEISVSMDLPWVEPADGAREIAEQMAASLSRSGFKAAAEVRWGPVAYAIVEAAAAGRCDLIVLGSRPPSDLAALLVGSVVQQVIQRSDRPVLLPAALPKKQAGLVESASTLRAGRGEVWPAELGRGQVNG